MKDSKQFSYTYRRKVCEDVNFFPDVSFTSVEVTKLVFETDRLQMLCEYHRKGKHDLNPDTTIVLHGQGFKGQLVDKVCRPLRVICTAGVKSTRWPWSSFFGRPLAHFRTFAGVTQWNIQIQHSFEIISRLHPRLWYCPYSVTYAFEAFESAAGFSGGVPRYRKGWFHSIRD